MVMEPNEFVTEDGVVVTDPVGWGGPVGLEGLGGRLGLVGLGGRDPSGLGGRVPSGLGGLEGEVAPAWDGSDAAIVNLHRDAHPEPAALEVDADQQARDAKARLVRERERALAYTLARWVCASGHEHARRHPLWGSPAGGAPRFWPCASAPVTPGPYWLAQMRPARIALKSSLT